LFFFNYIFKYAGGISLYYKGKKIGAVNINPSTKGDTFSIQASKHPKHENAPLVFTKSNLEFEHRRKIREVNEDTKDYRGAWGFVDFMGAKFFSKDMILNAEVIKYLIDESSEARTNPGVFKDLISEKDIQRYVESFKSKRRDSNEYKEAVNFLKTYFDDTNKKMIDL